MVLQRTQLKFYLYRTFRWMLVVGVIFHLSIVGFSQVLFESFKPINNKVLKGFVFKTINNVHSYFQCYKECDNSREVTCYSINFYPSKGVCELNYAADWLKPSHMAVDYEGTHLSNLERKKDPSGIPRNCKVLKESCPQAPSGNYWLNIVGGLDPFLGYCDMETEGGGWTLVWSFTFSMYAVFTSAPNYVKPVPENMYGTALEQSNTPPRNETDWNAIDFQYWKEIGAEFLIKSNINNWVACLPGTGSLVTNTSGSLQCRFVKKIVNNSPCSEYPGKLVTSAHAIKFYGSTTNGGMYFFENSNTRDWPTHDPCAEDTANHKLNVVNPHTNVYIRKQT